MMGLRSCVTLVVTLSILSLTLSVVVCRTQPSPSFNVNSYPMIMANNQLNGYCANATSFSKGSVEVAWQFLEPDDDLFRNAPVYSADDNAVYAAAFTGFIYGIDSNTGDQLWESCIGKPPVFPGEPCTNSGIDENADIPYGQPFLLTNGNVGILRQPEGSFKEAMIVLNKTTGEPVWSYELEEYTVFGSNPTVLPHEGGDAILVWLSQYSTMDYAVINGTTGALITLVKYPDAMGGGEFCAIAVDPIDGTAVSAWVDTGLYCTGYTCGGIAKYDALTGVHIWNESLIDSFSAGFLALAPNTNQIFVPTTQMNAYSFSLDTGTPLWMAQQVVYSSDDMGYASVCADGTVVFVDIVGGTVAFNPTPEREMKPLWDGPGGDPMSFGVTTLADNTIVLSIGNSVLALNCTDGVQLWEKSFGNTDNGPGEIVAVSNDAIYANVFSVAQGAGAIVKLTGQQNR